MIIMAKFGSNLKMSIEITKYLYTHYIYTEIKFSKEINTTHLWPFYKYNQCQKWSHWIFSFDNPPPKIWVVQMGSRWNFRRSISPKRSCQTPWFPRLKKLTLTSLRSPKYHLLGSIQFWISWGVKRALC